MSLSHQNEMGAFLSTNERPLKSHPLDLTIDTLHNDDDPWPIEWMMWNILNDYLQPGSKLSDNEAARCLDAILPDNRPAQPNEEKEPPTNWMLQLSDLIWEIAKRIPCDHESQDKLVQLLLALKRLPITQTIENYEGRLLSAWNRFSYWHDGMRFALDYPFKREKPNQQTCDYYVNASAFAARVHAAEVQCPLIDHAFDAVEAAVGGVIPDHELLPCHIIGGAQWLVWATEWLWGDIRWGRIDYHERRQNGRDPLAFPPALWVCWLHGFRKVAATATGEGDDVKYWAGLAVAKMEGVMRSQGFTAEMMETWDPEKRSLRASIWEDEKYAHLFKVPEIKVPECKVHEKA